MNQVSRWAVAIVWAAATVVAGWATGELAAALILAAGSAGFLWLFLSLWRGSTFVGALVSFGVPGMMLVTGAMLFGTGHRWAGNTLMIGSSIVFVLLGYWVLTRWSSGAYVSGFAPSGTEGEPVMNGEWVKGGWGRGKSVPDLPACLTNDAIWPFAEFGAINPHVGDEDPWKVTQRLK